MKKFLFAILAAATIPALAGTATISTGPLSASCESGGGSITQHGDIYVACITDPVLYDVAAPAPIPDPTPTPAPAPGACGARPANTVVVDAGNLDVAWPRQKFSPLPQTIMAFKVTAGFTGRDTFTATKTSAASRSKRLVVSTCPGVLTPVGGQAACSSAALEATSIRLSLNSADDPRYYCKLTPGATYYVNAISKVNVTDSTFTCTNIDNCSFYASRSAPF